QTRGIVEQPRRAPGRLGLPTASMTVAAKAIRGDPHGRARNRQAASDNAERDTERLSPGRRRIARYRSDLWRRNRLIAAAGRRRRTLISLGAAVMRVSA